MDSNTIKDKFHQNVNDISLSFINAFNLEFTQAVPNLDDPLHRWMDFRMRYINPVPRTLLFSSKFPKKLSVEVQKGLDLLMIKLREGGDVNKYQSKSLIRFNDSSGKRKSKRTDLLWADWAITHLHITDKPCDYDEQYSERACSNGESWLLFCLVFEDTVCVIDVHRHDKEDVFSDLSLLKTVKDSWPEYLEQFKMIGVRPTQEPHSFTDKEVGQSRRAGISLPLTIDGDIFVGPGLGITCAATPLRVGRQCNSLHRWVEQLANLVATDSQIIDDLNDACVVEPVISLCVTPQGLAVYEEESRRAYTFPVKEDKDYNLNMSLLLSPEWAVNKLVSEGVFEPV